MTLGYFAPEFPQQTHAFFWREAQAIEASGTLIAFFSTRRPAPEACPHAFGEDARARTTYVYPPRAGLALAFLARRLGRLAAAIAYVAGLSETPVKRRAVLMGFILCAADLARECRARGIRHVHIHSCADAAHLGALANILDGLSYSLTLHGDLPVYGTDHAAKFARAALVTTVTPPLAREVEKLIPGRIVPVIWMGAEIDRFVPTTRAPMVARPLHAVTVSRLNFVKGHRFFLEAMARARAEGIDMRYSIAGDGPYRSELISEISRFGLDDRVELLGSVSQDRVRALLQKADIFALTSVGQGEAAPVAVMEAMACGLPVICSRIGGTESMLIDDENAFLVDQQDVEGILTALRRLARENGLAERISIEARRRAETAFDHRVKAAELRAAIAAAAPGTI